MNDVKRKVESTYSFVEKSASAFLNGPTEKWFPAYEVSRTKLHKAHCFDRLVDLVKAKKSYFKK